MIVPMKKVSLIVLSEKKEDTLKKLRRLGLMEIQITETSNSRVQELHDQIGELERCLFGLDSKAVGNAPGRSLTPEEALAISRDIDALDEERQALRTERSALQAELTRLQPWGEVDPAAITACAQEGIPFDPYEIPTAMYDQLGEEVTTLCLERGKATVKCLVFRTGADGEELGTITDLDTIDALVDGLSTEDWTLGEHAGDAQPDLVVSLYQEPTETVLGEDGAELIHLLDLAAYSEDLCIELRLAAVPLHLDFQVPQSALDALNRLTES